VKTSIPVHPIPQPPDGSILSQTNPTKLPSAFATRHMIATISFFNVSCTARAIFGRVCDDPRARFFLVPLLSTTDSVVVLLAAFSFVPDSLVRCAMLRATGVACEYRSVYATLVDLA
jgi:hypothetical protein